MSPLPALLSLLLRLLLLLLQSVLHPRPSSGAATLAPSLSGTLIMRPANGPARGRIGRKGVWRCVGVDAGSSCVLRWEKESEEKDGEKKRAANSRRGSKSETEKIERLRERGEERGKGWKRARAAAVMTGRPLSKLI